jgi:hypothetical protein
MKRHLSVSVLALIVVLALATTGLIYTAWAGSLRIDSNVKTASFGADFEVVGAVPGGGAGTCDVSGNNTDHLVIKLGNASPGYSCGASFLIGNRSTIPVQVQNVAVTNPNSAALSVAATGCFATMPQTLTAMGGGGQTSATCWLTVTVNDAAVQGAEYDLSGDIQYVQAGF